MASESISVLPRTSRTSKVWSVKVWKESEAARLAVVAGRALYSAIFIIAAFGHFSPTTIDYAAQQGVPLPELLVPVSGILSFTGGLSLLLGYRARLAALLLAAFLVPVTVMMHNFWAIEDPLMAQLQQAMFMKNLALFGAALLIAHFGAGPLSLDRLDAANRPDRSI
jgi:putative oxidoreductase